MRKRRLTRVAAGVLCGALFLTDAVSMNVRAVSNDLQVEQSAVVEEVDDKDDITVINAEEMNEETISDEEADKDEKEEQETLDEEEGTPDQKNEETKEEEEVEAFIDEVNEDTLSEDEETGQEFASESMLEELDANSEMAVMEVSDENIASGEINEAYGQIMWLINADGKLTVRGTGDYSSTTAQRAPWLQYRDLITSAVIDITGITSTALMFENCSNMTSADLSKLDTSQVTDMQQMFTGCGNLKRLDLSNFDTSQVTDMSCTFLECHALEELNLRGLETEQVTDMHKMFYGCNSLKKLDVSSFRTGKVTSMAQMYKNCSSLIELDLSHFDTSQVTNMNEMFSFCKSMTRLNVNYFDTGQVTNMGSMFFECNNLVELDLSHFNTENVTNMSGMFYNCSNMTNLNLNKFDISQVTNISDMFYGCHSLVELDLSSFQTNRLTSMSNMFYGCWNLLKLDLSHLDTSQVTSMLCMFGDCESLTKLDLSNFDTSKVTNMNKMFSGCKSLVHLDLSHFNTANVSYVNNMFYECVKLTTLDLSNFDFSNVTNNQWIFMNCSSLTRIDTPYNIKVSIYLSGRTWYTSDGTEVTEMPKNLDYSVALGLDHIPSAEKPVIPPYEEEEQEDEPLSKEEKFVRDVTQYSLANATEKKKKKIQSGLYDVLFKAEFAPEGQDPHKTVTFAGAPEFNQKWPYQNDYPGLGGVTIPDAKLGDITYSGKAKGCLSYGHFVSQHVYKSQGEPKPNTDLSVNNIKELIRTNVDPGETIGFYKWILYEGKWVKSGIHYVAYLGESGDGEGFQCISYGGGKYGKWVDHSITVKYFTYEEFVDYYVKGKGADTFLIWDTDDSLLDDEEINESRSPASIKIQVACPVEAVIERNGETLDSRTPGTVSFGSVVRNGDQKTFDLTYSSDYQMRIIGTGEGSMTVTLTYFDDAGVQIDQRRFVNVPITVSTEIESGGFDHIADFVLYVSDENDELSAWGAGPGETVSAPDNSFLPETSFEYDDEDETGIHYRDIPETGEIPDGLWVSNIPDTVYTGSAVKPEVRVYDGPKRLQKNKDYTISYKNNTNAAQSTDVKAPTVVVKGKGNYSGTETQTFSITKRDISDTYITKTFTDAYAIPANGKNPALVFSAKCNNKTLKKNTNYTLTVKDSNGNEVTSYAEEGTYSVVVKGVGTNYTGEYTLAFEVSNKIPVSKLKIGKISAVEYDGKSKKPELVIKYGNMTLNKGTDYSLRYLNNREMGTATVTIEGKGDYFGTRNVTFTITGRQMKKVKFTGFKSFQTYTGDTLYQSGAVLQYGGEELVKGTDYTVSYNNHLNKGKATAVYIGIGNYTGTVKKTYNITAYNVATDVENRISLSTDEISAVYEKGGAKPSVKVYDGTRLLTEGKDYTLSYQNNAAVTTPATVKQPTITVKGKGNYAGVLVEKKSFIITPKDIAEVTMTAPDVVASPKIGKYKSTPILTDTNDKKLKVGTDYIKTYTYTYKNATENVINNEIEVIRNAGDLVDEKDIIPANTVLCVSIKAKEGGNYTGEKTAEYRIVTSPISKAKITVQNPNQNNKNLFLYTGQEIRIDKSNLIVKVGADVLTDDQYEILEDTYKNNINKGNASVQIRGVGDFYGGTATVKFKIGAKGFQWFWRLFM
ncbi:MAG: BspA family leucine-rich repeat surface protein [Lachnospiraceae bacterium]|nr:BspA family leucine-rich repeat surface protein [Lachnospiraceae bacterium]